jgi:hypothetical protein
MPYTIRKVPNKRCYKVLNKRTKKVFAKCTSLTRAKKQVTLLRAIENNKNFVPNANRNQTRKNRSK